MLYPGKRLDLKMEDDGERVRVVEAVMVMFVAV